MGDGAPRIPIVGEAAPKKARGSHGLPGADGDALKAFKKTLVDRHIEYMVTVKKRSCFPDIPDKELEYIEIGGKDRMRKEAALACRALLGAARAALAGGPSAGDTLAAKTTSIGIQSAYRNYREDSAAWEKTFGQYYTQMIDEGAFAGDELGRGALNHLLTQMIKYKAPPGYSNHSNGLAVDFNTKHGKITYAASKEQNPGWKTTWFHRWLTAAKSEGSSVTNAASFGFKPLSTEAWHWDYDSALGWKSP
jgi:D-alanyl-D-alanine carboxypeptidase